MIIVFTPAKSGALRQYRSGEKELVCDKAGEYEVSESVGAELCADYPDNFATPEQLKARAEALAKKEQEEKSKPKDEDGDKKEDEEKGAGSPTHNRSAKAPGRNKGA